MNDDADINTLIFATPEAAKTWRDDQMDAMDESCVDNHRFAFEDDQAAMTEYEQQAREGCCGFFDRRVKVGGRYALVGCNYGH